MRGNDRRRVSGVVDPVLGAYSAIDERSRETGIEGRLSAPIIVHHQFDDDRATENSKLFRHNR